jgi:hypothetical protein
MSLASPATRSMVAMPNILRQLQSTALPLLQAVSGVAMALHTVLKWQEGQRVALRCPSTIAGRLASRAIPQERYGGKHLLCRLSAAWPDQILASRLQYPTRPYAHRWTCFCRLCQTVQLAPESTRPLLLTRMRQGSKVIGGATHGASRPRLRDEVINDVPSPQ